MSDAAVPDPQPSDADSGADVWEDAIGDLGHMGVEVAPQPGSDLTEQEVREAFGQAVGDRDSYLETAQRIQAEFDNYRKRSVVEVNDRVRAGLGRLAEALLPVLDTCDAAVTQGDASAGALRGQLLAVLGPHGLERFEAVGEPFDPTIHEAVLHEQGDGEAEVVVQELRPGYRWNGKILRAAMVKVRN